MFFKKIPLPRPHPISGVIKVHKEEEKLLSIFEFEQWMQIRFIPQLDFSDGAFLHKMTQKTLKLHQKNRLSRGQLWQGSYFKKEIMNPSLPPVSIRWIDSQVGWGVFATSPIKKMAFIGEYGGIVRKRRRADKKNGYCFEYTIAEGEDSSYVIDARDQGGLIRFINHSPEPNLRPLLATFDGISHVIFVAKEPIAVGSQLLYDYGPNYWTYRPKPLLLKA